MAVIGTRGEAHKIVPADQAEKPEAEQIAYELHTPLYGDRREINAEVMGAGVVQVDEARIDACLAEGFRAMGEEFGDTARAEQLIAKLESLRELQQELALPRANLASLAEALAGDISESRRAELEAERDEVASEIDDRAREAARLAEDVQTNADLVQEQYPPYAELMRRLERWLGNWPAAAARRLLRRSWNLPGGDIANPDERFVPKRIMDRIPEAHRQEIELKAMELFGPSEAERKNS